MWVQCRLPPLSPPSPPPPPPPSPPPSTVSSLPIILFLPTRIVQGWWAVPMRPSRWAFSR
eukprot:2159882-Pyramimonas_sp.AAC.1